MNEKKKKKKIIINKIIINVKMHSRDHIHDICWVNS